MNEIRGDIEIRCPNCGSGTVVLEAEVGNDLAVGIGEHLVDWRVSRCDYCRWQPDAEVAARMAEIHRDELIEDAIQGHEQEWEPC